LKELIKSVEKEVEAKLILLEAAHLLAAALTEIANGAENPEMIAIEALTKWNG